MQTRNENELQISSKTDPLPTVEVDLDSLPEERQEYASIVVDALESVASRSPSAIATVHVYHGPSINFSQQTWSVFFGVAGNKKVLEALLQAFRAAGASNVRFSDSINPSMATKDFHVQGGQVWRPLEPGTWFTSSPDNTAAEENSLVEEWLEEDDDDWIAPSSIGAGDDSRASSPARSRASRAARADASVSTIRRKLETLFGLPEGSVALCGPDKKPLRGDATIGTLRKRWE